MLTAEYVGGKKLQITNPHCRSVAEYVGIFNHPILTSMQGFSTTQYFRHTISKISHTIQNHIALNFRSNHHCSRLLFAKSSIISATKLCQFHHHCHNRLTYYCKHTFINSNTQFICLIRVHPRLSFQNCLLFACVLACEQDSSDTLAIFIYK